MKTENLKQKLKFATFALSALLAVPLAHAEDCRFGRDACHAERVGRLWVETFNLTHEDGRPTIFHGGDSIARITQADNGYSGYKLKRVGFLVARDSVSKPRIGVFINDERAGEREVSSHGNIFTGYNTEPVAVDVNDCPLNFYAIVQKGTVEAYAVNFYWEDPRGGDWDFGGLPFDGGEGAHITIGHDPHASPEGGYGGGYGAQDLVGITDRLAFSVEHIRDFMTPDAYTATVEPLLAPARRMHAEVRACGAICARDSALSIVDLESHADGYLQQLLTEQAASRLADGILSNVERIRAYYEIGRQ